MLLFIIISQYKPTEFMSKCNLPKVTLWPWVAILVRALMIAMNED